MLLAAKHWAPHTVGILRPDLTQLPPSIKMCKVSNNEKQQVVWCCSGSWQEEKKKVNWGQVNDYTSL